MCIKEMEVEFQHKKMNHDHFPFVYKELRHCLK